MNQSRESQQMNGLSVRLLCVRTLIRAEETNSYGNLALNHALKDSEPKDAALCTAVFQGVTERRITLDTCIAKYAKRGIQQLDLQVRYVLRCGMYELLYLHTPESAVVNLWTEITKKLRKTSASGMVNAILRSFIRDGKEIPVPQNGAEALSVRYSVPMELIVQLQKDYDEATVAAFLENALEVPPIYVRRNPLAEQTSAFLEETDAEPVEAVTEAYRLKRGAHGEAKTLGQRMHVQDLASQLCCLALDAQPGETVLDVCAAPGGKTFTIAEMMQNQGSVYAYDLHENRVNLIKKGAESLKLTCITAQVGDARSTEKPLADRVLCDVPCSGYGVIRRKPEIRYKALQETEGLPEIQSAILEAAAKAVKPGGVLVYSTCTILKRENEEVVQRFLASHPEFVIEKPWQNLPALAAYGREMTTLFPHMLNSDGFFLAKMRRQI
ncbi:MAG: 16S rRNA (cytosine(967)-C(5))-methyltransferase RsmB [Oscillospiraceae bacterium]|nr:16S rRNA (cytosine(967)-C(5))-methyltransferase RsmB [Oscillospiraceae bacterium]